MISRNPLAPLALVSLLLGAAAGPVRAQLKDPTIGSRVLTDADMTKYVAVQADVELARTSKTRIDQAKVSPP